MQADAGASCSARMCVTSAALRASQRLAAHAASSSAPLSSSVAHRQAA